MKEAYKEFQVPNGLRVIILCPELFDRDLLLRTIQNLSRRIKESCHHALSVVAINGLPPTAQLASAPTPPMHSSAILFLTVQQIKTMAQTELRNFCKMLGITQRGDVETVRDRLKKHFRY